MPKKGRPKGKASELEFDKDDYQGFRVPLGYIAGLFDGEGCIKIEKFNERRGGFIRPAHRLTCTITNTNPHPLAIVQDMFGGNLRCDVRDKDGWRNVWRWSVSCAKAGHFLEVIKDHLIIKKQEAEVALDFQDCMLEPHEWGVGRCVLTGEDYKKRDEYMQELKNLKKWEWKYL